MATVTLSEAARRAIQEALRDQKHTYLRLTVTESFDHELSFGSPAVGDAMIEQGGVRLLLDRISAARAEGVSIDAVAEGEGVGFVIHNPNRPRVKEISPKDLKTVLDTGGALVLIDVRTPEERELALIAGSRLFDRECYDYLMTLDRATPVVFQCHHGVRSMAAAEHCLSEGFTNVFNLTGGIDAWSRDVDPSVPRY